MISARVVRVEQGVYSEREREAKCGEPKHDDRKMRGTRVARELTGRRARARVRAALVARQADVGKRARARHARIARHPADGRALPRRGFHGLGGAPVIALPMALCAAPTGSRHGHLRRPHRVAARAAAALAARPRSRSPQGFRRARLATGNVEREDEARHDEACEATRCETAPSAPRPVWSHP